MTHVEETPQSADLRRDQQALRWHARVRGKIQILPKCAIRNFEDFAVWDTPGVAAPCQAIVAEPERVYDVCRWSGQFRPARLGDHSEVAPGLPSRIHGRTLLPCFPGQAGSWSRRR